MAKYSSDSDSDRSSSRHRKKYSRRSSSVDSSDSSSSRQRRSKYSKSRRRYRSRSRSRDKDRSSSSKNYKRSRDASRDRRKNRSHRSKSSSAERKSKRRSASREKSTSRSSSSQSNVKVSQFDKAGPSLRDNFLMGSSKPNASVLHDINNEEFVPRSFTSSAKDKGRDNKSKLKNIVIDMNADTIHVPKIANSSEISNSIFHGSIIADKEAKFERWVKKLYNLRQKAMNDLV